MRGVSWTTSAFVIVPGQVDTRVERAGPVLGDGVVLEECVEKVMGESFANLFITKITNY